jgi:hypothetical protein
MDAPTHCRFIELGCDWQGTKRMLEEHERTCILGHVGRLLEQQQRRQEALEIENARLLERVQQLEVETGAMREELQALREMISLSPLSPNGIRLEEQQHLMMNETDQLRQDIAALSATVQSIEMKQDQQVNHELVCQKKDIQILRELYQSLALQVRRMHRIRRTPIESGKSFYEYILFLILMTFRCTSTRDKIIINKGRSVYNIEFDSVNDK